MGGKQSKPEPPPKPPSESVEPDLSPYDLKLIKSGDDYRILFGKFRSECKEQTSHFYILKYFQAQRSKMGAVELPNIFPEEEPKDIDWQIPSYKNGDISFSGSIFKGGEGETFKANATGIGDVCVKMFFKFDESSKKEVTKLLKLKEKHPNIINYLGTYETSHPNIPDMLNRGYVMELMAGGSLADVIYSQQSYEPEQAYYWMCQISHAVNYLHLKGIAHFDLKPQNILLDEKLTLIKLGDFGLSKNMKASIVTARRATYMYMAPELFGSNEIDVRSLRQSDVYSLGLTFWEILYRTVPFDENWTDYQLAKNIEAGIRPNMDNFIWEEKICNLIKRSWAPNPSERCSVIDYIVTLDRVLQSKCPNSDSPFSPKKLYSSYILAEGIHCFYVLLNDLQIHIEVLRLVKYEPINSDSLFSVMDALLVQNVTKLLLDFYDCVMHKIVREYNKFIYGEDDIRGKLDDLTPVFVMTMQLYRAVKNEFQAHYYSKYSTFLTDELTERVCRIYQDSFIDSKISLILLRVLLCMSED